LFFFFFSFFVSCNISKTLSFFFFFSMAQQYTAAAQIVGRVLRREASTRAVFDAAGQAGSAMVLRALVCETLRYRPVITALLAAVPALSAVDAEDDQSLTNVLVYELLFGKGRITGGGQAKRRILESKDALCAALKDLLVARGVQSVAELVPDRAVNVPTLARFARVNALKIDSVDAAVQQLGLKVVDAGDAMLENGSVRIDSSVPYVLEFAPGTDLHDHALVRSGALVLQDKSSCLPAHCLMPPPDALVVDACAAPGNKTTQLASLMGADCSGAILAFDRDRKRYGSLQDTVARLGATHVDSVCADFVRCAKAIIKPEPTGNHFVGHTAQKRDVFRYLARATHALVDPSCSGSGLVTRDAGLSLEHDAAGAVDDARIAKLARFQHEVLVSAMNLPAMRRVVYSTCSVHERENEDVVRAVLADARLKQQWRQVDPMPSWPRRGTESSGEIGKLCLRTDPALDRTSGFFVALFERDPSRMPQSVHQQRQERRAQQQGQRGGGGNFQQKPQKRRKPYNGGASGATTAATSNAANPNKKRRLVKRPLTTTGAATTTNQ
jgi:putative methyltransferase